MRTSIRCGTFVLFALLSCVWGQTPAHKHHPYLQRAIERLAGSPHLSYRAEVTLSDEIAGSFVRVSGRVILQREGGAMKLAIDGTVKRDGRERGVSLRSVDGLVRMCDHTTKRVTSGSHRALLDDDANLISALLSDWMGREIQPLDAQARDFDFVHGEQFGGETCHVYRAPGPASANPFLATLLVQECSFSSSDGMPRRTITRTLLPDADVRTRGWRLVSWKSRPFFSRDPFALPNVEGYVRVKPRALVEARLQTREPISLAKSLDSLTELFNASKARVKVIASVSPT